MLKNPNTTVAFLIFCLDYAFNIFSTIYVLCIMLWKKQLWSKNKITHLWIKCESLQQLHVNMKFSSIMSINSTLASIFSDMNSKHWKVILANIQFDWITHLHVTDWIQYMEITWNYILERQFNSDIIYSLWGTGFKYNKYNYTGKAEMLVTVKLWKSLNRIKYFEKKFVKIILDVCLKN